MNLEEIQQYLKSILTEKRYNHSVGTSKMAKELAKIYGLDEEKAEFAGLIHDIAKEMSKEEADEYIKSHGIILDEIEKEVPALLHAKLGASITKEKYNADEQVQNAILYHTTGHKNMDTFAKIIYIADKIEENRTFDGVEELREIAKKDLDKAILRNIDYVIEKAIRNQRKIHPDTTDLKKYILEKK